MDYICEECGSIIVNTTSKGKQKVRFCSKSCYSKAYSRQPHVLERKREAALAYSRTEEGKARQKAYRALSETKEKIKAYQSTPERKEWRKEYNQGRRAMADTKVRERLYRFLRRYNLTEEMYVSMVDERKGCCDICGESLDDLHIDHCHDTGRVRGLLCRRCNTGLGSFGDSIEGLEKAVSYLKS